MGTEGFSAPGRQQSYHGTDLRPVMNEGRDEEMIAWIRPTLTTRTDESD